MSKTHDVKQYYRKHLARLFGCEVVALVIDDAYPTEVYTGIILKDKNTGNTFEVMAMSDPEGNGPGHFSITPIKDAANA